MLWVPRSAWGARPPRSVSTNITPGSGGVAVHYWGGNTGVAPDHGRCAPAVRAGQAFHMDGRGWADIAYSAIACPHGYLFEGRWIGRRTAANGSNDGNQRFYAVCYLGGDGDPLTDAGLHAIRDGIDALRAAGAGAQIVGHRDLFSTSCPGTRLYDWVRRGAPRPGGQPGPGPGPTPPPEEDDDMPTAQTIVLAPGEKAFICVPPSKSGGAQWGQVWGSLGADNYDRPGALKPSVVRVAIKGAGPAGEKWYAPAGTHDDPAGRVAHVHSGRTFGWQFNDGDEGVSLHNLGPNPVSFMWEAARR